MVYSELKRLMLLMALMLLVGGFSSGVVLSQEEAEGRKEPAAVEEAEDNQRAGLRVSLTRLAPPPAAEEEVAEAMSIELEELQQAISDYSRASLASLYDIVGGQGENEEVYLIDLLGDPDSKVAESVEQDEIEHLIVGEIDALPDQEKKVVALYYKENLTLKEIGVLLRVTESRVSQIHAKAMLRIRGRLRLLPPNFRLRPQ